MTRRHATPPRRILIAGISGAGKTSLAAALSRRLAIPHVEMDALYHGPGWTRRAGFVDDVERFTASDAWVCDAEYHWIVGDLLAARADLFVWLDLPRHTVMRRVIRRSLARVALRRPLWHGNTETWRALLFPPPPGPLGLVPARGPQSRDRGLLRLARRRPGRPSPDPGTGTPLAGLSTYGSRGEGAVATARIQGLVIDLRGVATPGTPRARTGRRCLTGKRCLPRH